MTRYLKTKLPTKDNPEQSLYFWWYAYLKRVYYYGIDYEFYVEDPGGGYYTTLHNFFGDLDRPFWDWWVEIGQQLFDEDWAEKSDHIAIRERGYHVKEISPKDILKRKHHSPDAELYIYVNLNLPVTEIRKRINVIISKRKRTKKGGRRTPSTAIFKLHSVCSISALWKTLEIFDLKEAGLSHLEIAKRMNMLDIDFPYEKHVNNKGRKEMDGWTKDRERAVQKVSRYLKHAQRYIDNVAKGIFPKKD